MFIHVEVYEKSSNSDHIEPEQLKTANVKSVFQTKSVITNAKSNDE